MANAEPEFVGEISILSPSCPPLFSLPPLGPHCLATASSQQGSCAAPPPLLVPASAMPSGAGAAPPVLSHSSFQLHILRPHFPFAAALGIYFCSTRMRRGEQHTPGFPDLPQMPRLVPDTLSMASSPGISFPGTPEAGPKSSEARKKSWLPEARHPWGWGEDSASGPWIYCFF